MAARRRAGTWWAFQGDLSSTDNYVGWTLDGSFCKYHRCRYKFACAWSTDPSKDSRTSFYYKVCFSADEEWNFIDVRDWVCPSVSRSLDILRCDHWTSFFPTHMMIFINAFYEKVKFKQQFYQVIIPLIHNSQFQLFCKQVLGRYSIENKSG